MWQGWINLILGVWLILSAFVAPLQTPANLVIVGILAAVFGFSTFKNWQGDVAGVMGVWAFLCGVWFKVLTPANFLIVGLILAISGLWEGLMTTRHATPHTS